ncbi:MAG: hypothetical protein CO094_09000 [Anaerolineae bacterium CG_4_9_14_3_um_filter_57_17]|nr:hypothetical protein [bacterium]NCT20145.1 hypothetical protein [bacterium]OIO85578.1 MAG: hypothetical protein AUK01_05820 [Anaerolineae bacterium CG2_30_57_67]PJB65793.1 MAG: hypothetical protein CO094_09000 [Anaerolineae bacterium CG_4_9_14_3_um_filter_57_17]
MNETSENTTTTIPRSDRARLGLTLTALGFLIFTLGSKPEWLGLDRSPVIGFVQTSVFTIGLGLLCLGGYVSLSALWSGQEKSILADIGPRLMATGYVVAVFAGMADIFGMGTQPFPAVPFFGPWQAVGVQVGEAMIALGMLLLVPYHQLR